MTLTERAKDLLQVRPARRAINREIERMAAQVVQVAPAADGTRTIVSFNASTRITGLSQNAAFALLTGWLLRLQGVRLVNFVCKRGMQRCVLGTRTDDVLKAPPCAQCIKQSDAIYAGSEVVALENHRDAGLEDAIRALSLAELQEFTYENIPWGSFACLPCAGFYGGIICLTMAPQPRFIVITSSQPITWPNSLGLCWMT